MAGTIVYIFFLGIFGGDSSSAAGDGSALIDSCVQRLILHDSADPEPGLDCYRNFGNKIWEPMRIALCKMDKRSETYKRGTNLLDKLLAAEAGRILHKKERNKMTEPAATAGWRLCLESTLFPYLKYYKYWDRYPQGILLNLFDGKEVVNFNGEYYRKQFVKYGQREVKDSDAAEYMMFFIRLNCEPYSAENIVTGISKENDHYIIKVEYKQTRPWSPPGPVSIAGSITEKISSVWKLYRTGKFEMMNQKKTAESRYPDSRN
jgi:hypothetical protein